MITTRMHSLVALCAAPMAVGVLACSSGEAKIEGPRGRLVIAARALTIDPIVDASYRLAVYNLAGDLVWSKTDITSGKYGDAQGAISYIGPCDAASSPNRVELTVQSLEDATHTLGPDEWVNPTANGPLVQLVECEENSDRPVDFNLTIMRPAKQGFFDIGVEFSDIFCSAKVDCQDELLFDPETGERAPTVVMGLACTSGAGEPTWLHYDDIFVRCDDGPHRIFPSHDVGNGPGDPEAIYGTGHYRGQEAFTELDKCYWNVAIGIDLGLDAKNCKLEAYATASSESFAADGMATPGNTIYPYIGFTVDLTDDSGQFVCTSHPLGGTPAGVAVGYTDISGRDFKHEWECDDTSTIVTQKRACDGTALGQTSAAFVQSPGGVRFELGEGEVSPQYLLDPGLRVGGCCANPCTNCSDVDD